MSTTTAPGELQWKVQGPFEVASDGRRLSVRETAGSEAFGTVVALVFMAGAAYGGWKLVQGGGFGARIFGALLLLFALFVATVAIRQLLGALGVINPPTRSTLVVFDRGDSTVPASIYCGRRSVPSRDIRSLSTRPSTVSSKHQLHRHIVIAELHDGKEWVLNIDTTPDWAAQYAQQGARWLGMSYQAFRR